MYAAHFGLEHEPFSIAPDPRYLFMSERHRDALAHLLYGVGGGGGFVLLSGEIGAGKTTVCRCFLEQVPATCHVAYIFNPKLSATELLETACEEFGIALPPPAVAGAARSVRDCLGPLNAFLLQAHAAGRSCVLIIDEAQNLEPGVLEQLRLLTNLETAERKLLQIMLIGQPELRALLARPELEQLAQRVIARYHLDSLSEAETGQYVAHRMQVAGLRGALPFDAPALQRIHRLTRGVPRRINLLCDRALLGAYALGRDRVDRAIVDKAAAEVFGAEALRAGGAAGPGGGAAAARGGARSGWAPGLAAGVAGGVLGVLATVAVGGWWLSRGPGVGTVAIPGTGVATGTGGQAAVARSDTPGRIDAGPAANPGSGVTGGAASAAGAIPGTLPGEGVGMGVGAGVGMGVGAGATAAGPSSGPASASDRADAATPSLAGARDDEADAWRALAARWGVSPAAGPRPPCADLPRQQLVCWHASGTLAELATLDRPAWLRLKDAQGHTATVLLLGLGPAQARVLPLGGGAGAGAGPAEQTWARTALQAVWAGEYGTLWRSPPGYVNLLVDGVHGPAVDVLAAQLARLDGRPAPVGAQGVDAALKARVAAFQRAQGQPADGVAGPATFMRLNRVLGVTEPRLMAAATPDAPPVAPAAAPAHLPPASAPLR